MNYEQFKKDILIAVDFGDCSLEEIEESIQEWYSIFKRGKYYGTVDFCKEEIPIDRDNSTMWLSSRGIAILELIDTINSLKTYRI